MENKEPTPLDICSKSTCPVSIRREPLALDDMLTLIKSADERGRSVKAARDMKSLYDAVSSELYSVWYAIGNGIPLFADNVPELIEFTGWRRREFAGVGERRKFRLTAAM